MFVWSSVYFIFLSGWDCVRSVRFWQPEHQSERESRLRVQPESPLNPVLIPLGLSVLSLRESWTAVSTACQCKNDRRSVSRLHSAFSAGPNQPTDSLRSHDSSFFCFSDELPGRTFGRSPLSIGSFRYKKIRSDRVVKHQSGRIFQFSVHHRMRISDSVFHHAVLTAAPVLLWVDIFRKTWNLI